jgi:hypothetical protein
MSTHAEMSQCTIIPATIARIWAYLVGGGHDDVSEGIGCIPCVVSWESEDVREHQGSDGDELC